MRPLSGTLPSDRRARAYYPLPRTSPNATPVVDILKAFSLNCLVGGTRFAHGRRSQDDVAVATITGMSKGRLCGEDAFRRLKPLNASPQGTF